MHVLYSNAYFSPVSCFSGWSLDSTSDITENKIKKYGFTVLFNKYLCYLVRISDSYISLSYHNNIMFKTVTT